MKDLFHANVYYDRTHKVNGVVTRRSYIRLTNQYKVYFNKKGFQLLFIEYCWR